MSGGPFADKINAATKYIATNHPESLKWGPLGDLGADAIAGIRRITGRTAPDVIT